MREVYLPAAEHLPWYFVDGFWFSGQGADMRLILLSFCTHTYGGKFILQNGEY